MICAEERLTFVGEDDIEIEMRIPQEAVKLIIGRQGANIKQVSVWAGSSFPRDWFLLSILFPHSVKPTYTMYILNKQTTSTTKIGSF